MDTLVHLKPIAYKWVYKLNDIMEFPVNKSTKI